MKTTIENLISVVTSSNAKTVGLVIASPAKMNKRNNPLAGETVLKNTVGEYDFGGSYEERVNEALAADGSTNTFTAKGLPFGQWLEGAEGKIIVLKKEDKTTYYLRYYNGEVKEMKYTVNGEAATEEQLATIKEFTPVRNSNTSRQTEAGLSEEKQIRVQCVSFDNIKSITLDNETYELD